MYIDCNSTIPHLSNQLHFELDNVISYFTSLPKRVGYSLHELIHLPTSRLLQRSIPSIDYTGIASRRAVKTPSLEDDVAHTVCLVYESKL